MSKSVWNKAKIVLPMACLLLAPWTHWVVYHNMLLAWPAMDHETAHYLGVGGCAVAFVVSLMIAI